MRREGGGDERDYTVIVNPSLDPLDSSSILTWRFVAVSACSPPLQLAAGDSSLQNALELVHEHLSQILSYGHHEVLILYSALSTSDPGDIMETIQKCKKSRLRCSVIGLSAEMFICKHLCKETGGLYSVAVDEVHLKNLLLEHAPPPPEMLEHKINELISHTI